MQFDPESFGKAMGEAIRRAVDPLHDQIKRIEERVAELSGKEEPAPPVEAEDLKPLVERSVSEFLSDLDQKILSHVEKAVSSIPPPEGWERRQVHDGFYDQPRGGAYRHVLGWDAQKLRRCRWEGRQRRDQPRVVYYGVRLRIEGGCP